LDEHVGVEGLANEVGGADVGEGFDVLDGGVAGEDDDGAVWATDFAELIGEDEAGDIGEVDIDDGGGHGEVLLDVLEGIDAVVEDFGGVAFLPEDLGEGAGDDRAIVDDEDRGRATSGVSRWHGRELLEYGVQNSRGRRVAGCSAAGSSVTRG